MHALITGKIAIPAGNYRIIAGCINPGRLINRLSGTQGAVMMKVVMAGIQCR